MLCYNTCMSNKLWFKAKRYGWGWTPATWEGWLVLVDFIVLFAAGEFIFMQRIQYDRSWQTVSFFILYVALLVSLLIYISCKKGEKPRWRWGGK